VHPCPGPNERSRNVKVDLEETLQRSSALVPFAAGIRSRGERVELLHLNLESDRRPRRTIPQPPGEAGLEVSGGKSGGAWRSGICKLSVPSCAPAANHSKDPVLELQWLPRSIGCARCSRWQLHVSGCIMRWLSWTTLPPLSSVGTGALTSQDPTLSQHPSTTFQLKASPE
jgi:hypothetical protein